MKNQSILNTTTVYLSLAYFQNLIKDISLSIQQKPNAYLLQPQLILPQHHITLLNTFNSH
ncbi:MAG TPA: hypothetical protein VKT28_14180 [Puia sp.]|nr:hypothetical protein [Puia sp.]